MSILRPSTVKKIFVRKPGYRKINTFIETGTYLAKTIRNMLGLFDELHTIELSEKLHADAVAKYGHYNIKFHLGDSAMLLPRIAERAAGPIFFYLDAHGFARPDVSSGFPLWRELKYISGRPWADIVLVDDVATFGSTGNGVEPGWAKLTTRKILDYLGSGRNECKMIENNSLIIFRRSVV